MLQISETAKEKIRSQFPVFQEAAHAFYAKELAPGKYKGTSGKFGSYGERGANSSMLRLRFSGGAISQDHMAFLAQAIDKYHITLAHFTTGEALQLHHLQEKELLALYQDCFAAGIYCAGAGGDNPPEHHGQPTPWRRTGRAF